MSLDDDSSMAHGTDLPHLSGPAAAIRQVLAAHFVRECPHVLEFGGHLRPVTPFLTHHPLSVTSVDPNTEPLGELLYSLIDNAAVVVLEHPANFERAAAQVPHIISRPSLKIHCSFALRLEGPEIAATPYAERQFYVVRPAR